MIIASPVVVPLALEKTDGIAIVSGRRSIGQRRGAVKEATRFSRTPYKVVKLSLASPTFQESLDRYVVHSPTTAEGTVEVIYSYAQNPRFTYKIAHAAKGKESTAGVVIAPCLEQYTDVAGMDTSRAEMHSDSHPVVEVINSHKPRVHAAPAISLAVTVVTEACLHPPVACNSRANGSGGGMLGACLGLSALRMLLSTIH